MHPLTGKIALVAGATRGAGRGIACMLGEAGATVYCTGRSTRAGQTAKSAQGATSQGAVTPFDLAQRPETIEETAEMVSARGGAGFAVRVDHTKRDEVAGLIDRIGLESGRLDILVNDIWGGDQLAGWGQTFWEHSLDDGLLMMERAIDTHIITAHAAAPLLIKSGPGLIVEITDGEGYYYRGTFFYDLVKTSIIRMAFGMAHEYGFTDVDGEQPQFDMWMSEHAPEINFRRCDDGFYEYWV